MPLSERDRELSILDFVAPNMLRVYMHNIRIPTAIPSPEESAFCIRYQLAMQSTFHSHNSLMHVYLNTLILLININ